ncbi:hypothetical protein D8674_037606 [Pyrus ussuriensis x Pyrus communis]|uniref:Uncharacterized protein n=1 Tax=Pyrus ussuriensis x Pyrus communis TaxID=2448454 RepID=A0A5N5H6Z6_9ROSA|nr:hypothetical protein D8674_037606 [Pyrus ussuriensis x Pyrus communis]
MIRSIKLQNQRSNFSTNSTSINEWHQKCLEMESTLVALQQQLNKVLCKLEKHKTKHFQEECDSAFYDGFDKFPSYLYRVRLSYDWDYIMASLVEDIVKDGGEYTEHKYVKVAHNIPKDA